MRGAISENTRLAIVPENHPHCVKTHSIHGVAAQDSLMRGADNAASASCQVIRVSHWTILCDFDGTIAVDDTTDTLLERFGTPGWEVLEADWRAGRIGSHDCMAGQVALLDMDRNELDAHLALRAIDPAFATFVKLAHRHGLHIEV